MFQISPEGFSLDGRPLRLLSGAMHYFRTHPAQWPHRLRMLRAMGLNTVETYVPWNLHEPRPGEYDFSGLADLDGFLQAAADAGLYAIVRPSPYICAEWENGGLPWWLLADRAMRLRVSDPAYLAHVERWFDRLIPVIARHQITRSGNVLMVQIENEYGSYGSDRSYLEHQAAALRNRAIDVPLFTSDGPDDFFLTGGTLPGQLATVNFGSQATEAFASLRAFRPDDPPMCMEFWCGWFDHWGEKHTVRTPQDAAATLREILEHPGASVNIYMAHGGTNFGTWAGANRGEPGHAGAYQPTVTSYDYDAPIDERGAPTPKFRAFREVLSQYAEQAPPEPEPMPPLLKPGRVELAESVRLFDVLGALSTGPVHSPVPLSFEELGIGHGLVLYEATVPGPRQAYPLTVEGLADRAQVYVDGRRVAVLERDGAEVTEVAVAGGGVRLGLLVESMGRVNYGPRLGDRKGITGVLHTQQYVHGWTARPVPLDGEMPALPWGAAAPGPGPGTGPVFRRGFLDVDEPGDAYLALPGGTKGYVWVNGFCLGRYWDRGPQVTLYLPWPVLRAGRNEIVVLELDEFDGADGADGVDRFVEIRDRPELG